MIIALAIALALGLMAVARVLSGGGLVPAGFRTAFVRRRPNTGHGVQHRGYVLAVVVAAATLIASRNFVLAVIAGSAVVIWPLVTGGGKAERAELAKLEALAQWTESLRDLAQKGAGLESVIPKTIASASGVLEHSLRQLSARLAVRVPLPQALSLFADDVDHAGADLVVGALALSARQRRGQLSRVLAVLATSLRDELEQRTKIMRERNGVRREAAQVAGLSAILVLGSSMFSPQSVSDGHTVAAQLLPVALAAGFLLVFARVRKLAQPPVEPRFLSSASDVLEAATFRPKGTIV